jgi:hypothetical protein
MQQQRRLQQLVVVAQITSVSQLLVVGLGVGLGQMELWGTSL